MIRLVQRLCKRLHIDRATLVVIASRVWQFLSGSITTLLIVFYLSEVEQGLYQGFNAILNSQSFFDAGLANVIITLAGSRFAKAKSASASERHEGAQQLGQLLFIIRRWYAFLAVAFLSLALVWGCAQFSVANAGQAWLLPWLVIVPLSASAVWFAPQLSMLEATGHRQSIYLFRLWQTITGSLAVWFALINGWALWTVVASVGVQFAWMFYLVAIRYRSDFDELPRVDALVTRTWWRTEVRALQWRVAVQSILVYLASQLFVMIIIPFEGLIEGGRLGLTLAALSALQQVAMAWLQTRFVLISNAAATSEPDALWTQWRSATVVSLAVLIGGGVVFAGLLYGLGASSNQLANRIANRFSSPTVVVLIVFAYAANHLIASQSFFAMARWRKLFFNATLIGLGFTATAVWIGGWLGGTLGLAIAYAIGIAGVFLPLQTWAFVSEWDSRARRLRPES